MKIIINYLIVLLLISSSCQSQNENNETGLEGKWIAIKGLFMDGVILDITPSSINLVKALEEKTTNYKYKIDQDYIEIDTSSGNYVTLGKIVDLSTDRFKLASEDSDTFEFLRLKNLNDNIETVNFNFKNTCWKIQLQDVKYRIDFGDQLFFGEKSKARKALLHKLGDHPSRENVYWILKEFKNKQILYISDASYNLNVYIIKSEHNDRIHVKSYTSGILNEEYLERIPNKSNDKKREIISYLTSKKWTLSDFDTIQTGESQFLFESQNRDSLLNIDDLKTRNISYEFKEDGKLNYKLNDSIFITSDWSLSNDGNFIWSGSNPTTQCIEIEKISKGELIINKFESIYLGEEYSAPVCMIKLKLK